MPNSINTITLIENPGGGPILIPISVVIVAKYVIFAEAIYP